MRKAAQDLEPVASGGGAPAAAEISPVQLKDMLKFPQEWGPTNWGPIPFLPDPNILVQRMESQWGELRNYRGLMTTARGHYLVPGVQLGNVWGGRATFAGRRRGSDAIAFREGSNASSSVCCVLQVVTAGTYHSNTCFTRDLTSDALRIQHQRRAKIL